MNRRGLSFGHGLALTGTVGVAVSLWMPWFSIRLPDAIRDLLGGQGGGLPAPLAGFMNQVASALPAEVHANAWAVFRGADVLMVGIAVLVAAFLLASAGAAGPSISVHHDFASQVAAWGGAVLTAEIIFKLLNPPVPGQYVSPALGAWVGLASAVAICAGGCGAAASSERHRSHAGALRLREGYR